MSTSKLWPRLSGDLLRGLPFYPESPGPGPFDHDMSSALPPLVQEALRQELDKIAEQEITLAYNRIKERLKNEVARVAIRIAEMATVEPYGRDQVKITIIFKASE